MPREGVLRAEVGGLGCACNGGVRGDPGSGGGVGQQDASAFLLGGGASPEHSLESESFRPQAADSGTVTKRCGVCAFVMAAGRGKSDGVASSSYMSKTGANAAVGLSATPPLCHMAASTVWSVAVQEADLPSAAEPPAPVDVAWRP
eukprot:CAMPEP_0172801448 /NCGR_PEP_ID=MMETSP1075-20121228/3205_1 /TAXON_ID=2916 /ORGANISM="Ceratium fusus, Strain PA161109" /LENGTH=145 /DNA_ID=CAMNT_0013639507 /DNA_START=309 /DNA_END=743 /DNA_ORIENTATION=+